MIQKYAIVEEVLEVKNSLQRLSFDYAAPAGNSLNKFAKLADVTDSGDGYMYIRCRAISSRVNKNNDGWPSRELMAGYQTFIGRPVFVDHHNDDPKRTRGVIVDAVCHVDEDEKTSRLDPYYSTAPENHKPPTWIELLIEVDAKTFPKLAKAIRTKDIDSVSMGSNIEKSVCSVCANEAETPEQYCDHIKKKGLTFEITADNGEKIRKKAYEDCIGLNFFEISFVFDPADSTALITEKKGKVAANPLDYFVEPVGTDNQQHDPNYTPQSDLITAPQRVDTLRSEHLCPVCRAADMQSDPDGIMRCPTCGHVQEPEPLNNPDLSEAHDTDLRMDVTDTTSPEGDKQIPVTDGNTSDVEIAPMRPVTPVARKQSASEDEISEMFETIMTTESKTEVNDLLSGKVARIAGTFDGPLGFHAGTAVALRELGKEIKLIFPVLVDGNNSVTLPKHNPIFAHFMAQESASKLGKEISEVPFIVEAESPELAEKVAQILRESASQTKRPILNENEKPSDEPKGEKIVADEQKPRESSTKTADEGVVEMNGKKYKLIEIEDENEEEEKVEMEAKNADRRYIVRQEQNSDGVVRSEEIVEESDAPSEQDLEPEVPEIPLEEEQVDRPVEEEDPYLVPAGIQGSMNKEDKLLAAMKLADQAVEMGIVDKESKMRFIATLEDETDEALLARQQTFDLIKSAGLSKTSKLGRLGSGVVRLPRLAHNVLPANQNGAGSVDNIPDEAIFIN